MYPLKPPTTACIKYGNSVYFPRFWMSTWYCTKTQTMFKEVLIEVLIEEVLIEEVLIEEVLSSTVSPRLEGPDVNKQSQEITISSAAQIAFCAAKILSRTATPACRNKPLLLH
jgi:hypothetical protein